MKVLNINISKEEQWSIDRKREELLDIVVIGVSIATPEGDIVYANQALLDLFETTKEKFVGRNAREFYVNPDERKIIIDKLQANEKVRDIEVELVRDNGTTFQSSLSLHLNEYAGSNHYFCLFFDLTKRIELENLVIEKNNELLKAKHFEELFELSQKLAHEIYNPLSIVKGNMMVLRETLKKEDDLSQYDDIFERSLRAIDRITDSVNALNKMRSDEDKK